MRGALLMSIVLLAPACDRVFVLVEVPDAAPTPDMTIEIDAAIDAATALCPPDYNVALGSDSYRYKHVSLTVPWDNAASDCALDKPGATHLLVITLDDERLDAAELLANNAFWIGLTDRKVEGGFGWVTAEPAPVPTTRPPWSANQPDNLNNQDCVAINTTGTYDDVLCQNSLQYICECDAFADDPIRYTP